MRRTQGKARKCQKYYIKGVCYCITDGKNKVQQVHEVQIPCPNQLRVLSPNAMVKSNLEIKSLYADADKAAKYQNQDCEKCCGFYENVLIKQ